MTLRFARTLEDAWKLIELMAISDIETEMCFIRHKHVKIYVGLSSYNKSGICVEIKDHSIQNSHTLMITYDIID